MATATMVAVRPTMAASRRRPVAGRDASSRACASRSQPGIRSRVVAGPGTSVEASGAVMGPEDTQQPAADMSDRRRTPSSTSPVAAAGTCIGRPGSVGGPRSRTTIHHHLTTV